MSTLVLLVVVLKATVGVAQNPMFTPEYICQDKIIQYRCVLNSPLVQLIAEPLISATGTPLVIDSSVDVPIPDVLDSSGNSIIKVKQICEDPFTITMAISTSLSEISQVTCVDIGIGTNTSLEHTLDFTIVEPRTSVRVQQMDSNSTVGFVLVETEDSNTTQTFVNCSGGMCKEETFDGTENVIVTDCDATLSMNVYAVNECNELSSKFVAETKVTCDDPCGIRCSIFLWLFIISTVIAIILLLIIGILVAYIKKWSKEKKLTQDTTTLTMTEKEKRLNP